MTLRREHIGRRFERVAIRLSIGVTTQGILFRKTRELECKDISGGGLSLETSQPIAVKARSRVLVGGLGNLPSSVSIEGRVVYRNRDQGSGRTLLGIEFTRFINTTQEELVDCISQWPYELPSPS